MRSFTWFPVGILALVVATASLAQAATVAGTVTGPDGGPFRGAFVQARNAKTKITVSVLSDPQGRYQIENLPAGDYRLQVKAIGYKAESEERGCARRRPGLPARHCAAEVHRALERPLHVPGKEAPARRARQGRLLPALHGLPRLRVAHGDVDARRGRLARPRQLHARRHGLFRQRSALRLQRPEGGGRRLLSQSRVRRRVRAAEIARGSSEVQGRGAAVRRQGDEDRLCGIRAARRQSHAVERASRQGRKILDSLLRPRQRDRAARPGDRRDPGISRRRTSAPRRSIRQFRPRTGRCG